jgi:hypothetical protein
MRHATCLHTIVTHRYRSETWSFTLREEHKLQMFENKVLGKIYGLKKDEVSDQVRILGNKELHDLYC